MTARRASILWAISAGVALLVALILASRPGGSPQGEPVDMTGPKTATLACENPASGAVWTVTIDFRRRTADSFPAEITDRKIVWRDTLRGGSYRFSRLTGALTVIYPSSTGGFILQDRCSLSLSRSRPTSYASSGMTTRPVAASP